MGYDLPASIGAAVARHGKRVVCLAGEGSIQMNVQELGTIAFNRLPVKIFVFENGGYLSIRQTQENLFAGHFVGEAPAIGCGLPRHGEGRRGVRNTGAPRGRAIRHSTRR